MKADDRRKRPQNRPGGKRGRVDAVEKAGRKQLVDAEAALAGLCRGLSFGGRLGVSRGGDCSALSDMGVMAWLNGKENER